MIRFVSLFSGVGGFDLGFERAGMECVAQVEIDSRCREVLAEHWPSVARYEDVRTVNFERGTVDLICGGFPCQDLSVAGKRAGLAGERSGLWHEFHRILAESRPRWAVIENVPGLLSSNGGRDFAIVLRGLVELGYGVCWRILDAQYFGVAQRRRRVFIVASLGDGRCAEILFERESGGGDSAPSREAEASVAGALTRGLGSGGADAARAQAGWLVPFDTGQGDPNGDESDMSYALNAQGNQGVAICFEPRYARNGRGAPDSIVPPLKAQSGQTGKGDAAPVVAYNWQSGGDVRLNFGKPSLHVGQVPAVGGRRLTPVECCRLQGFPDDWNANQSDSARYKQMGNAVCVPVVEWIGRRLVTLLSGEKGADDG